MSEDEDIINIFGTHLAEAIHKPPLACKGLLRFVIRDYYKEKDRIAILTLNDLDFIFTTGLKNQLVAAQIPNVDKIIPAMQEKLLQQQAIFTMNK